MAAPVTEETPLTDRQREVYRAIYEHTRREGQPPTIRDLMAALGVSGPNGIVCHLTSLRKRGLLAPMANRSRTLLLTGIHWLPVFTEDEAGERARRALGVG